MPVSIADAAKKVSDSNKGQSSQAILITSYADSVLEQPNVNFSGFKTLGKLQNEINTGLGTAQAHAHTYLNTIQPAIISNIANIENYYALHNAVASTLPAGSTEKQWIEVLTTLKTQSAKYEADANTVVVMITGLHDNLTTDAAAFAKIVAELNAAVKGDGGVLDSINGELGSIQSKIDGAIAGIALSGLAIMGGVFMIAVGGIADFVTAGASTPLVIAGIAVVAAGIGGEVASALTLKSMNDEKANLLQQKSTLKAEVQLATGIGTAYQSLGGQVKLAVAASTDMKNAWNFLGSDLDSLVSDLDKGITNVGKVRELFLTAADKEVGTVVKDISVIKNQMRNPTRVPVPAGTTVGDAIVAAAKKAA